MSRIMLTSLKLHNKKAYPIEDRPFYFIQLCHLL
jgi:hypothetical protein